MMMNPIKKLLGSDDDESDLQTMELQQVKWTEPDEKTYEVVKERLVWGGGAEKVIEHVPEFSLYNTVYTDRDGEVIIEIEEPPAYTEVIDRWDETEEIERGKRAWVSQIPPNMEPTGNTKEVYYE